MVKAGLGRGPSNSELKFLLGGPFTLLLQKQERQGYFALGSS